MITEEKLVKWQYKIESKALTMEAEEAWLNEMGQDGWELFDIVSCGICPPMFYFRRNSDPQTYYGTTL